MDINLFDYRTMSASPGQTFPTTIDIDTAGDMSGIRVETTPIAGERFAIPGGRSDVFGTLTNCAAANSVACSGVTGLAEGRSLVVTVNVRNAQTGELMFFQSGQFTQDSEPPQVLAQSVLPDPSGNLIIELTAMDAATSPIHSDFWFSADRGLSWDHVSLEPVSDVMDEPNIQTFQGVVGTFVKGFPVQYFFSVQDVVSNTTYLGVGEVIP